MNAKIEAIINFGPGDYDEAVVCKHVVAEATSNALVAANEEECRRWMSVALKAIQWLPRCVALVQQQVLASLYDSSSPLSPDAAEALKRLETVQKKTDG